MRGSNSPSSPVEGIPRWKNAGAPSSLRSLPYAATTPKPCVYTVWSLTQLR